MKIPFILILIFTLICPSDAFARRHKRHRAAHKSTTAVSALLWNATDNKNLYAKDIDRRVYPASTTKVMTALLVLERLPLDQYVTVKQSFTKLSPTKLGLKRGERYKVRDLLYAILLKSANDAAMVLAEAVAGSQPEFISMMNRRAAVLGARNTKFANAHGLPSKGSQFSTARDIALIFKSAMKKPFFAKVINTKYRVIYSKDGRRFFLKSHNRSLFLGWKADIYGKTGFTRQAQSCFVGYYRKNKDMHIVAVFGCRKRWQDIKHIVEHYGGKDL